MDSGIARYNKGRRIFCAESFDDANPQLASERLKSVIALTDCGRNISEIEEFIGSSKMLSLVKSSLESNDLIKDISDLLDNLLKCHAAVFEQALIEQLVEDICQFISRCETSHDIASILSVIQSVICFTNLPSINCLRNVIGTLCFTVNITDRKVRSLSAELMEKLTLASHSGEVLTILFAILDDLPLTKSNFLLKRGVLLSLGKYYNKQSLFDERLEASFSKILLTETPDKRLIQLHNALKTAAVEQLVFIGSSNELDCFIFSRIISFIETLFSKSLTAIDSNQVTAQFQVFALDILVIGYQQSIIELPITCVVFDLIDTYWILFSAQTVMLYLSRIDRSVMSLKREEKFEFLSHIFQRYGKQERYLKVRQRVLDIVLDNLQITSDREVLLSVWNAFVSDAFNYVIATDDDEFRAGLCQWLQLFSKRSLPEKILHGICEILLRVALPITGNVSLSKVSASHGICYFLNNVIISMPELFSSTFQKLLDALHGHLNKGETAGDEMCSPSRVCCISLMKEVLELTCRFRVSEDCCLGIIDDNDVLYSTVKVGLRATEPENAPIFPIDTYVCVLSSFVSFCFTTKPGTATNIDSDEDLYNVVVKLTCHIKSSSLFNLRIDDSVISELLWNETANKLKQEVLPDSASKELSCSRHIQVLLGQFFHHYFRGSNGHVGRTTVVDDLFASSLIEKAGAEPVTALNFWFAFYDAIEPYLLCQCTGDRTSNDTNIKLVVKSALIIWKHFLESDLHSGTGENVAQNENYEVDLFYFLFSSLPCILSVIELPDLCIICTNFSHSIRRYVIKAFEAVEQSLDCTIVIRRFYAVSLSVHALFHLSQNEGLQNHLEQCLTVDAAEVSNAFPARESTSLQQQITQFCEEIYTSLIDTVKFFRNKFDFSGSEQFVALSKVQPIYLLEGQHTLQILENARLVSDSSAEIPGHKFKSVSGLILQQSLEINPGTAQHPLPPKITVEDTDRKSQNYSCLSNETDSSLAVISSAESASTGSCIVVRRPCGRYTIEQPACVLSDASVEEQRAFIKRCLFPERSSAMHVSMSPSICRSQSKVHVVDVNSLSCSDQLMDNVGSSAEDEHGIRLLMTNYVAEQLDTSDELEVSLASGDNVDPFLSPPMARANNAEFKTGGLSLSEKSPSQKSHVSCSSPSKSPPKLVVGSEADCQDVVKPLKSDLPEVGPVIPDLPRSPSANGGRKISTTESLRGYANLKNSVKVFDHQYKTFQVSKVGVVYVGPGQDIENDEIAVLANQTGSCRYDELLDLLGELHQLNNINAASELYLGGLSTCGKDGTFVYVHRDDHLQVVYHVATLIPNTSEDVRFDAKRAYLGNDYVTIIYNDTGDPDLRLTRLHLAMFMNIIVSPLPDGYYKVDFLSYLEGASKTPGLGFGLLNRAGHPAVSASRILHEQFVAAYMRHSAVQASLQAMIIRRRKMNVNDPYCANWVERLKMIRRMKQNFICSHESPPPANREL